MQPVLKEIKKELAHFGQDQLMTVCLRLARYKKENKELLSYLLFYADDPNAYAAEVMASLEDEFSEINRLHDYYSAKSLRKILRMISRHAKYTASKQVEAEFLLWFCKNFLAHTNTKSSYKPLRTLFVRQLQKALKLTGELQEDLQHDLQVEADQLIEQAVVALKGFSRKDLRM